MKFLFKLVKLKKELEIWKPPRLLPLGCHRHCCSRSAVPSTTLDTDPFMHEREVSPSPSMCPPPSRTRLVALGTNHFIFLLIKCRLGNIRVHTRYPRGYSRSMALRGGFSIPQSQRSFSLCTFRISFILIHPFGLQLIYHLLLSLPCIRYTASLYLILGNNGCKLDTFGTS